MLRRSFCYRQYSIGGYEQLIVTVRTNRPTRRKALAGLLVMRRFICSVAPKKIIVIG